MTRYMRIKSMLTEEAANLKAANYSDKTLIRTAEAIIEYTRKVIPYLIFLFKNNIAIRNETLSIYRPIIRNCVDKSVPCPPITFVSTYTSIWNKSIKPIKK